MTRLARARQALASWVYPPLCGNCDRPLDIGRQVETPFLCEECEEKLVVIGDDYCRICGQSYETPPGALFRCANCGDRELAFDFAVSAYRNSGVAREVMHRFKYGKEVHLARLMGRLADRVWRDERFTAGHWWVVPVPLHSRRMRKRGFNQAREIAVEVARRAPAGLTLELRPLLQRSRHTVRQARLDRRERLANPEGAFRLRRFRPGPPPDGLRVLIVDDVITTGSTVSECAAVIRRHYEPESIAAVSVMRG